MQFELTLHEPYTLATSNQYFDGRVSSGSEQSSIIIAFPVEDWRPYRMWATVLLHIWIRREAGGPHRQQYSSSRSKVTPGKSNKMDT